MAIRKMAVLNFDINFIEGDRQETPLQLATRSQHLDAVNAILDGNKLLKNVPLRIYNRLYDFLRCPLILQFCHMRIFYI